MRKNRVYILIYLSMLLPVLLLTEVLASSTSHVSDDVYIEFRTKTNNYSAAQIAELKTYYHYKTKEAIRERNIHAASHYQRLIDIINIKVPESNLNIESDISTIKSKLESKFDFENLSKKSSIPINTEKEILIKHKNLILYIQILAGSYVFALIINSILIMRSPSHQAKDFVKSAGLYAVLFGVISVILVTDLSKSSTMLAGSLSLIAGYMLCSLIKEN